MTVPRAIARSALHVLHFIRVGPSEVAPAEDAGLVVFGLGAQGCGGGEGGSGEDEECG